MHLFALEMQSTGHNPKSSDAQLVPPIRIQWSYFRAPEFYLEENPADIEVPLHNFTYYFDFENSFCCHFIYYPKSFLGLKSFCKDQPAGKRISYLATATHRSAMPDGFYRAYIYIYIPHASAITFLFSDIHLLLHHYYNITRQGTKEEK